MSMNVSFCFSLIAKRGANIKAFSVSRKCFLKLFSISNNSFTFQNSKNLFAVAGAKVHRLLSYPSAF